MTVGLGFVIFIIAFVVLFPLYFIFDDYDLVIVLLVLLDIVASVFLLIVVVFWIYAMVSQNINPFEALGYVMWE